MFLHRFSKKQISLSNLEEIYSVFKEKHTRFLFRASGSALNTLINRRTEKYILKIFREKQQIWKSMCKALGTQNRLGMNMNLKLLKKLEIFFVEKGWIMWIKDEIQKKSYRRSAGGGFGLDPGNSNNPKETHKESGEKN